MKSSALKSEGRTLIGNCRIARDFFSRFMGLMGRGKVGEDEAILFPHCNSIHTFFMRIRIDVILVDGGGRVIEVLEGFRPWRMMLPRRDAKHIIEMKAQRTRELGIKTGMVLEINGVWG
jgi:uncharacterized membrane protein (UPF0127 family)